ncbi:Atl [Schleiferilactobacillus shenzhenensis LY-73]|uniref:Atl n=1 Tax=Schleiferilactobacillus shenzhenensis LY-73 TaxID=1231336 RepID=U4TMA6_9LACO|nr:Atl [Schleiferilactobacillus shenzhenensis LY-73]
MLSLIAGPAVTMTVQHAAGPTATHHAVQAATDINAYIAAQGFANPAITTYATTFTKGFAYRNGVGRPEGIVIHETANPNSTIDNEIAYMQREWMTNYAYVHAFVDGSRIINIHPTDYGVWGAGPAANARYIQIELVQAHSLDEFARSVNNDAYYTAYLLKQYGLPVSLADTAGSGTVWSHNAVSSYLGGTDHTDPVGYFAQWGYDMDQFFALVQKKYNALNGGGPTADLDQVVSSKGENLYGQVQGNNINGTYVLTSQGFRLEKMSAAYDGQVFRIDQSAQTDKGVTMYEMADESGKGLFWAISSQVDVLGTWHPTPAATLQPASGIFTVTSGGRGTPVLDAPGGLNRQARFLAAPTRWQVHGVGTTPDGQRYYKVGTNQWVSAATGNYAGATPPAAETPTRTPVNGVVRIASTTGAHVYGSPQQNPTGRVLPANSAWRAFEKATFKDGSVWYRVSGKEWIPGTAATWQAAAGNNGGQTSPAVATHVLSGAQAQVTAAGGAQLRRSPTDSTAAGQLAAGSRWRVNKAAVLANGQVWYLVGTNQWLSSQQAVLNNGQLLPLQGIVRITASAGATMINTAGQSLPGVLRTGSRWQVTGFRVVNGTAQYRVATNAWVTAGQSAFQ